MHSRTLMLYFNNFSVYNYIKWFLFNCQIDAFCSYQFPSFPIVCMEDIQIPGTQYIVSIRFTINTIRHLSIVGLVSLEKAVIRLYFLHPKFTIIVPAINFTCLLMKSLSAESSICIRWAWWCSQKRCNITQQNENIFETWYFHNNIFPVYTSTT